MSLTITEFDHVEEPLHRARGLLAMLVRLCDQVPPGVPQIDVNPEHLSIALGYAHDDIEVAYQRLSELPHKGERHV